MNAARWGLAVAPVGLLIGLVLWGRWSTTAKAAASAASAAIVAAMAFGAGPTLLMVAFAKGAWNGVWILCVIWPALLLFEVASGAGLADAGEQLAHLMPRPVENVLLVAWVLPSFVQGVAGFGTPIAVAAPLLVAMGLSVGRAVALPLIGYQWAVTFGSMGSSFYMGAVTAGLAGPQLESYAATAALMLSANLLLAGMLVCLVHGGMSGLRSGLRMLLVVGVAMAVALNVAVRVEPSIGSLTAGGAGLLTSLLLRAVVVGRRRANDQGDNVSGAMPLAGGGRSLTALLPYVYLLVLVLAVFLPSASRMYVKSNVLIGPSFPRTATALGVVNPAVSRSTPVALFAHPGSYLLVAAVLGVLTYKALGTWPQATLRPTLRSWLRRAVKTSGSVLALTVLAAVLVDSGMVRIIAAGAVTVTGKAYPAVSPLIGALGSFSTGSTTTSNALFAALQRDAAALTGLPPALLVAAQTAGGNVGNALAPVIMLVGTTALGSGERLEEIFRRVLPPACALLGLTSALIVAILVVS